MSICQSVCLYVSLPVCLSVSLYVFLSVCPRSSVQLATSRRTCSAHITYFLVALVFCIFCYKCYYPPTSMSPVYWFFYLFILQNKYIFLKKILVVKKTLRELQNAARQTSHRLSICQVVFTKLCHYYYCHYYYCPYCHY